MPRPILPNTESKPCFYCTKERGIASPYSKDGLKAAEAYGIRPVPIGAGHSWIFQQYGRPVEYVVCLEHYHSTEQKRDAEKAEKAARKDAPRRAPAPAPADLAALIAQGVAQALQALGVALPQAPAAPAPAAPAVVPPAPAAPVSPAPAPATPAPRDFDAELETLRRSLEAGKLTFGEFLAVANDVDAAKQAASAPAPAASAPAAPRRPSKG